MPTDRNAINIFKEQLEQGNIEIKPYNVKSPNITSIPNTTYTVDNLE
jgi:hypothetical protein